MLTHKARHPGGFWRLDGCDATVGLRHVGRIQFAADLDWPDSTSAPRTSPRACLSARIAQWIAHSRHQWQVGHVERDNLDGKRRPGDGLTRRVEQTFPASDPIAPKSITGTEPPPSDPARTAPVISREQPSPGNTSRLPILRRANSLARACARIPMFMSHWQSAPTLAPSAVSRRPSGSTLPPR